MSFCEAAKLSSWEFGEEAAFSVDVLLGWLLSWLLFTIGRGLRSFNRSKVRAAGDLIAAGL